MSKKPKGWQGREEVLSHVDSVTSPARPAGTHYVGGSMVGSTLLYPYFPYSWLNKTPDAELLPEGKVRIGGQVFEWLADAGRWAVVV